MANRLIKPGGVQYTPAVPYQPAVPAYCVMEPYTIPAHYTIKTEIFRDPKTGELFILQTSQEWVPESTGYRQVCFDAIPEQQAVPGRAQVTGTVGWDSGARSIAQLDANGAVRFSVVDQAVAVVVGLAAQDVSTLPSEPSHALYIHGTTIDVMEMGVVVHTASIAHDGSNEYSITRNGATVLYSCGAWSYVSKLLSNGAVILDASLYSFGDFVDNPEFDTSAGVATGSGIGAIPLMDGNGYDSASYADGIGRTAAFTGVGYGAQLVTGGGTIGPLLGVGSESTNYTYGVGGFGPLTGTGNGGFPETVVAYGVDAIPPLAGVGVGLVGTVGTGSGAMGPMSGWGGENGYAEGVGVMGPLTGYGVGGAPTPGMIAYFDALGVGDFFLAAGNPVGSAISGLELASNALGVPAAYAVYVDALMVSSTVTMFQSIEASIMSGLLLGNDLSTLLQIEVEPSQYAVNVLNGALTTYVNFGFDAFTRAGQQLYGSKSDGVYMVRPGDDNGLPIRAIVDFGQYTYGSNTIKSIEAVFLGLSTDGQVYLRMRADDGQERVFVARERGPSFRVNGSKGIGGRKWNITLEVVDATDMVLDTVEHCIFDTKRRWTSQR